jgi:hypothetical protein
MRIGEETSSNSEDNLLTTIGRLICKNTSSCSHTFYQSGGISGYGRDPLYLASWCNTHMRFESFHNEATSSLIPYGPLIALLERYCLVFIIYYHVDICALSGCTLLAYSLWFHIYLTNTHLHTATPWYECNCYPIPCLVILAKGYIISYSFKQVPWVSVLAVICGLMLCNLDPLHTAPLLFTN